MPANRATYRHARSRVVNAPTAGLSIECGEWPAVWQLSSRNNDKPEEAERYGIRPNGRTVLGAIKWAPSEARGPPGEAPVLAGDPAENLLRQARKKCP